MGEEKVYHVVDKWDASQVKNLLDESAKQYILDQYKYEESNFLVDIRLVLCFLPVCAAFYALIYDFMHPFPESADVLKTCVYSYFALMIIMTIYSTYVESNTILIAYKKGRGNKKSKIRVMSKMKRFDDQYTLIVEGPKSKNSCTKSVGNYFDINGVFAEKKFEQDLRSVFKFQKGPKGN